MLISPKYKREISYRIDHPKEVIIHYLIYRSKDYEISGNTIKIRLKPGFFNASSPRGSICFTINEAKELTDSSVQAEIVSTTVTNNGWYVIVGLLSIWTLVALIISLTVGSFFTVITGWIIMTLMIHLIRTLNQGKLENYANDLMYGLKQLKSNSIA